MLCKYIIDYILLKNTVIYISLYFSKMYSKTRLDINKKKSPFRICITVVFIDLKKDSYYLIRLIPSSGMSIEYIFVFNKLYFSQIKWC